MNKESGKFQGTEPQNTFASRLFFRENYLEIGPYQNQTSRLHWSKT
jgi:hypothetical protein